MVYKVISLVCDNLSNGLGIGYVELQNQSGNWQYAEFLKVTYTYPDNFKQKLTNAQHLHLEDFTLLHNDFGTFLSGIINEFIKQNNLDYRVQLIALKGYTITTDKNFHLETGNPAFIAAATGINVIADFIAIDAAFGGNGDVKKSAAIDLLPAAALEIQLALLAVLRWREENNFLAEKTGASRSSIGGAVWIGQEA